MRSSALAMAIDRGSINRNVSSGQILLAPPPSTAGSTTRAASLPTSSRQTREAGYPNGEGFTKASIIFNTSENHRSVDRFRMWRKHLNIEVELNNQEWKVYLMPSATFNTTWSCRIGDYVDPNSFLDVDWSQQNQTG